MFKQTLHARKLMVALFWDRKGVLIVEFMQHGTTVTSEVYYLNKKCIWLFRTKHME
jgi:hypothetical protein